MLEEIRQIKLFTTFLKHFYFLAKKRKKRKKERKNVYALGTEAWKETFGKLTKEYERKVRA